MKETKTHPSDNGIMDIRAAAQYLMISPDTIYKYAITGFIPAFKLGNRWRFRKSSLDEWMVSLEATMAAERQDG